MSDSPHYKKVLIYANDKDIVQHYIRESTKKQGIYLRGTKNPNKVLQVGWDVQGLYTLDCKQGKEHCNEWKRNCGQNLKDFFEIKEIDECEYVIRCKNCGEEYYLVYLEGKLKLK